MDTLLNIRHKLRQQVYSCIPKGKPSTFARTYQQWYCNSHAPYRRYLSCRRKSEPKTLQDIADAIRIELMHKDNLDEYYFILRLCLDYRNLSEHYCDELQYLLDQSTLMVKVLIAIHLMRSAVSEVEVGEGKVVIKADVDPSRLEPVMLFLKLKNYRTSRRGVVFTMNLMDICPQSVIDVKELK